MSSSPHYKPGPDSLKPPVIDKLIRPIYDLINDLAIEMPHQSSTSLCFQEGNKWIIKPRALEIIWGSDARYWRIPGSDNPKGPVELLQVSWLEVTGSLDLDHLDKGKEYKLSFKLKLKPDAFGWADSPVYMMVKPGKSGGYIWKRSNLSPSKPGEIMEISVPANPVLKFKVPENFTAGDKLQFGMYEIWKGRWKGGLVIHEVVIEPFMND